MGYRLEEYIIKDNKKMRYGYTTGTCAAAAAKAAVLALLAGRCPDVVEIATPKGFVLSLPVEMCQKDGEAVSCAVRKDAGDDPDVTDGILVCAAVSRRKDDAIFIDGGRGVGRVTKPGLDQPVGNAAINRVPRRMIEEEAAKVCAACGYDGGLDIILSIPDGERLAVKTFNPRLGIVGGISILGTSGIVEPMSEDALVDTIKVEMNVQAAQGNSRLLVAPGNYGEDFLRDRLGIRRFPIIKCSNFVGDTVKHGRETGVKGLLFIAHVGKFIKVAAGILNTHSKYGDGRMETIVSCAREHGLSKELEAQILDCVMADEALRLLDEAGLKNQTMTTAMARIKEHLTEQGGPDMGIEAIVFSNQYGELGRTDGAGDMLEYFRQGGTEDDRRDA